MIFFSNSIYRVIDRYTEYLINEGLTTQTRAFEKKFNIINAVESNLKGIVTHRPSPYTELGSNENCLLYVYKDPKSRTQWGFAYKRFDAQNVIVYYMKNLKLLKDYSDEEVRGS